MSKLKAILEKIDPTVFTEEAQNELATLIEEKVAAARTETKEEMLKYASAEIEKMDTEHTTKLEQLVESIDADHSQKLTNLVESIDEDHTTKLQNLLETIDEDHAQKLKSIIEAIDETHGAKLEQLIDLIDEDHSKKLQRIVESYEAMLEEKFATKVSDYLDTYIEESLPSQDAVDKVKLSRLQEAVDSIKKMLVINDDFVQSEVKEAIFEAKQTIDSKESEINKLLMEKIELTKKISTYEVESLLKEKTKDMPAPLKKYVEAFCRDSSSKEEASSRLCEAVEAFEKQMSDDRTQLIEENKGKGVAALAPVINESLEQTVEQNPKSGEGSVMEGYAAAVNKSLHARR